LYQTISHGLTTQSRQITQGSKNNYPTILTAGSPKGSHVLSNNSCNTAGLIKSGDGVVIVRAIGRTTVPSSGVRTFTSKAGLLQAIRGSDANILPSSLKNDEINIKKIANLKNLVAAYELIKSNPGNMTPGISSLTLDGMNLSYLKSIQGELKAGVYKFPPARRIYIPKPGKDDKRPLTIASPRDKIVQKAIQLVLEQEYEKIFLNSSHGFRPKRGTKTAIQYLEAKFQSSHYIIEADLSKAFDTIQHDKLMEILKKRIKCEKTLSLIKSGLKAGYIEFGNLHDNLSMGTPQGSVLSPILCNIYLHKLDVFVEKLKSKFHKGEKRMRNKEYEKLQNKVKY
jgi:retron-type reverse transcriptase